MSVPDYARPMPLSWKPDKVTVTIERNAGGKTVKQSMDLPLLADGTIYVDMLTAQYDRLRRTVWTAGEEQRLAKAKTEA